MESVKNAQRTIALWREDLRRFVTQELHVQKLDYFQEEALLAASGEQMPAIPRIALKASKGPGKTAVLAWIGLGSMATRVDLRGACISITGDNLRDNLWAELAKWHSRSEFLKRAFTWTKTRYYASDRESTWWLSFRTFPKNGNQSEQADALAGLHEDNVIVLADETGSYPSAVMATAEAILSSCVWGLIVQAGNPTSLSGPLYDACTKHRDRWKVITINGDPENPHRASRVSVEWATQQIEMYGRDNPWVIVNVFGEFPPGSLNTILGPDEVEAAMRRYGSLRQDDFSWSQKRLGVDVARFGDDRTVIFPRQGLWSGLPVEMRVQDTVQIAGRVQMAIRNWAKQTGDSAKNIVTFVDDTGHWGHGVIDNLRSVGRNAHGVVFSDPGIDKRYKNRRAEMWLEMADWVKKGGALPNVPELVAELTTPEYTFTNGKFLLQEKDQIKEVLGRSPDLADALALTFAIPDISTMEEMASNRGGRDDYAGERALMEYNPVGED